MQVRLSIHLLELGCDSINLRLVHLQSQDQLGEFVKGVDKQVLTATSCRIKASFSLPRVPGEISISLDPKHLAKLRNFKKVKDGKSRLYSGLIGFLGRNYFYMSMLYQQIEGNILNFDTCFKGLTHPNTEFSHFNTSHKVEHLSFGREFPGMKSPLENQVRTVNKKKGSAAQFKYAVKVLPTVFHSPNSPDISSNQYSVNEHVAYLDLTKLNPMLRIPIPGIYLTYSFFPLVTHKTEHPLTFLYVCLRVLSILGACLRPMPCWMLCCMRLCG